MIYLKVYQKYIINNFLSTVIKIFFIFFSLAFILSIFEEISFFKDFEIGFFVPFFLTLLNVPSIIYEIFPFIFLISTQFFFIKLADRHELIAFKNFGLENTKVLKLISITTFFVGILLIAFFYNISANMKFLYFEIKNEYTKDNKYLATITENGLWIKDEINGKINIINAEKIDKNKIVNVDILQFDQNFNLIQIIYANEVDITNNTWHINKATLSKYDSLEKDIDNLKFSTNFNYEKINNLFSNLSSLNMLELRKIKKDYDAMNYSTTEINSHIQKIFSYPLYLMIMTILAATIMMNIKYDKPKVFHLIFGILLSVTIYYVHYFLTVLGKSEKIPVAVSIWIPLILLTIISSIGLIRINEK
tara:strand:+ start:1110 stop:2195 length:1086 start_codon:yes stop_codon:yes gene_type:complete